MRLARPPAVAIYEVDFCDCSYGFRPGRSCHQALRAVNEAIMSSPVHYVIEADIQGFFDHVSYNWMMKFLAVRIRDSSLLLLIRRFLKAGSIDSALLVRNDEGTPQGDLDVQLPGQTAAGQVAQPP